MHLTAWLTCCQRTNASYKGCYGACAMTTDSMITVVARARMEATTTYPQKVLVVDDLATDREKLQRDLMRIVPQVVVAADFSQAMKFFEGEDPPEMVISDWNLGRSDVDGLGLLKHIRGLPGGDEVYFVIFTSKYTDQCDFDRA